MKFLLPVGGVTDDRFGVLAAPATYGIQAGISAGLPWAADNQAFTRGFDPDKFFPWLESLRPFRERCLFVTVPDVVGDAIQTLYNWRHWRRHFSGWPLAFVAQDGQEDLAMPSDFAALFIGGSTEWKESSAAISCIKRAQLRGAHIHIGRVNWGRRYRMFAQLKGSEKFTCDGTRTRYDGTQKAMAAWAGYMAQRPLITI